MPYATSADQLYDDYAKNSKARAGGAPQGRTKQGKSKEQATRHCPSCYYDAA
jgi:hypothetical protein